MIQSESNIYRWALQEVGDADLGHGSRNNRAVDMLAQMALCPAGRISDVFETSADREGAYCFVQNEAIRAEGLIESIRDATVGRADKEPFIYIPVDGSSLSLTDHEKAKDFGPIGASAQGGRGIKVLGAIAVAPNGVPLGVTALQWWTRSDEPKASREKRSVEEKETHNWLDAIDNTCEAFREADSATRLWFQLDREADAWPILHQLNDSGYYFTVRSNHNRRLQGESACLHDAIKKCPNIGYFQQLIRRNYGRRRQVIRLSIRVWSGVTLRLRDRRNGRINPLSVNVVTVRQEGYVPAGTDRICWTLLTNYPLETAQQAQAVVQGYCMRWRIEEFHKTWKSAGCHIEDTQLRDAGHVIRWATLHSAVAMRIERLKYLARNDPDQPASVEFSEVEIRAIKYMKNKILKRNEPPAKGMPTIGQATLWIAERGGYTGKSSGGPPGSITIGRGLEKLQMLVPVFADFADAIPKEN
jgi:hypothetical protein